MTAEARATQSSNSTENRTIENGENHVGEDNKNQEDAGLGMQIRMKKAPSKHRPSTRVRWVGRVLY